GGEESIVQSRAKSHNRALWPRRTRIKVENVVATIAADRHVARLNNNFAQNVSSVSEIPRDDVCPKGAARDGILPLRLGELSGLAGHARQPRGLIWIMKQAGKLERITVGGTEMSEERPVAWRKSDAQRRFGMRDGRFGGTAHRIARSQEFFKRRSGS